MVHINDYYYLNDIKIQSINLETLQLQTYVAGEQFFVHFKLEPQL